ncbi:MAG TPA: PilZ domain-containing protein [Spirochaetia bacterium]|nr:PilZ domain-containing protein [Spirochaetia bacterium]
MANELNRIEKEFILKTVVENKSPLEIHVGTQRASCTVTSFANNKLECELQSPLRIPGPAEGVFYFRFRGNPMTFKTKITAKKGSTIQAVAPREILRDLSRGYERIISPKGVRVTFLVDGKQVELNYPQAEVSEKVESAEVEPGFDAGRISELLRSFRERAREFSSENKIVMFRERKPQLFEERVIANSGKILILPFISPETLKISNQIRERLLTQPDVVRVETTAGEEVFTALQSISAVGDRQKQRGIAAELYCPVLFRQYVVGYLYLLRSKELTPGFDPKAIEFVFQFSRVLAYSLKVNGYFKAEPVKEEFGNAELIDISGSGLLFGYPPNGPNLALFTDLDLTIYLGEKSLPATGRVMRRYKDADRVYLGIRFLDMSLENMEILFQELYGEQYTGDVDQKGAADLSTISESDM